MFNIIIPIFNEEENLDELIKNLKMLLKIII